MLRRAPALGLDAFAAAAFAASVRGSVVSTTAPAAAASTASARSATGTLHVVATPLGNPADVTLRALQVLRECDLVAAEDTRVTRRLLRAHGVDAGAVGSNKTLLSCNDHNEGARVRAVLARLAAGGDVALVSDAGTPCVSDPGADVVAAAHAAGARVSPVPGPSALAAALSVAGVQSAADHGGEGALFLGFLPRHGPARRRWLADIASAHARRVVVLYESPHRVTDTLTQLHEWTATLWGGGGAVLGERRDGGSASSASLAAAQPAPPPPPSRRVLVCRELTKRHEQVVLYGSIAAARDGVAAQARLTAAAEAADGSSASGGDSSEDEAGGPRASRGGAWDDEGAADARPLGEFVLLLHPMALPPTTTAMPASGAAGAAPATAAAAAAAAAGPLAPPPPPSMPMPPQAQQHDAHPAADTPQQALEDAVDVVRQLVAAHGARLSEAVTTAAAVAGVRRKALMLAVARAGVVSASGSGRV
jgi:16S rRNA (cytidine1402-2'-O)-methyltransferase